MNDARFTIRARAARDLSGIATWLKEHAGDDTADRFLAAAGRSFAVIADNPGIGSSADSKLKELRDACKWRVTGFSNYLVFYLPDARGRMAVLRVLHAAQDWKRR